MHIAVINCGFYLLQLLNYELAAFEYIYLDLVILALIEIMLVVSISEQRGQLHLHSLDYLIDYSQLVLLLDENLSAFFI